MFINMDFFPLLLRALCRPTNQDLQANKETTLDTVSSECKSMKVMSTLGGWTSIYCFFQTFLKQKWTKKET